MFSCENISFVLRTHRCLRSMFTKVNIPFMYYVHSPWLSERESKLPIKLAKEWGGHRRGKPAALQRAGVPLLTFTNFEPKLHFKCRACPAKRALNLAKVYKTLNQSCILTPAEGRQNVEYPSVSPLLHVEECLKYNHKFDSFFFFFTISLLSSGLYPK